MTSIIRLKRQRDEDPIESLMVTCKKFKDDQDLQRTCQLTFAGTAKSANDCVRVVKKALHMEALDKFYICNNSEKEPIKVPKKGTKRARPADDMEVVSSTGAESLESLFQAKRAKLSPESKQSKFRLLDVGKRTDDLPENCCVFDIFYVRDPSLSNASLDVISFFIDCEDICDSEDEESKEEVRLDMNYFDDDIEEESYWSKDYPDEFNIFYEDDESDEEEEEEEDDGDDDDESRFDKEVQDMYDDNDYGDYIHHFVDRLSKSILNKKSESKKTRKSKKKADLQGSRMDWD